MQFSLVFSHPPHESPCAIVIQDLNPGNTFIPFINIIILCVFFPGTGRRWLCQHLKRLLMAASFMNSHLSTTGGCSLVSNRELSLSQKMMRSRWWQHYLPHLVDPCLLLCDCKWGRTQFLGPKAITQVEYLTRTLQHLGTI